MIVPLPSRSSMLCAAVAAFALAADSAYAQSANPGSLWRPASASKPASKPVANKPATATTARKRSADTVATHRVADSLAAVAVRHAEEAAKARTARRLSDSIALIDKRRADDSIAAVAARRSADSAATAAVRVRDSLAARSEQLDVAVRTLADTVAELRARLAALSRGPAVPATAASIALLTARLDSVQKAAKAADASTAQRLAGLGNFRFGGDVRVRYEGQFQGGGFTTRHRERARARLGITGNLTDVLTGGISIATGALDDVQSANQTQTGFFSRKTIGFDKYFVQWKPKHAAGFGIVAGKFVYPWERTSLTFGNDINPEGVATSLTTGKAHGRLQSATIVGVALPLLEVSAGHDSYVSGAQLQTRWKLGAHTVGRVSLGSMSVHGADAIMQASVSGTIKPSSANTNSVRDSAGKTVGFGTSFSLNNAIIGLEYTPRPKWPVVALLDFVENAAASPGSRVGELAELRAGRLSQRKDFQAAWTFYRIERDAVVGALNEQDLRAATNVINHKVTAAWLWQTNAALNLGVWYGHLLDPSATSKLVPADNRAACSSGPSTACRDPWLTRLQIDLTYKY